MTWGLGHFYTLSHKNAIQLEFKCERVIVKVLCDFFIYFHVLLHAGEKNCQNLKRCDQNLWHFHIWHFQSCFAYYLMRGLKETVSRSLEEGVIAEAWWCWGTHCWKTQMLAVHSSKSVLDFSLNWIPCPWLLLNPVLWIERDASS